MSDETAPEVATPEEKERMNSREHLWRAALWAGFAHQARIVELLQSGQVPWFNELAPLTRPERVFVMAQLCKQWFPDMVGENEKRVLQMLGVMYGIVKDAKKRSKQIRRLYTSVQMDIRDAH